MKEKTKKMIAGLGIGLALSGAGLLTGCTDVKLTQEQTDKILTVVDNSDKFMNDTMDLLNKSNKKLNKSEAYDLLRIVGAKAKLNVNGYFDNVRLTFTSKGNILGGLDCVEFLNYDNNGHFAIVSYDKDWGDNYRLEYAYVKKDGDSEVEKMVRYSTFEIINDNVIDSQENIIEEDYNYAHSTLYSLLPLFAFVEDLNIKEEDVVSVVVNEKGNYVIDVLNIRDDGDTEWKIFFTVEIATNAEFIKYDYSMAEFDKNSGVRTGSIGKVSFDVEYGVVDVDAVKAKIRSAAEFAIRHM